jgi:maltose-binding protein MalE
MGPDAQVWPQRKGNLITHDAFAVFFRLVTLGQPGILDEQFTAPLYDATGTKTGNMARNYHFLVSSKSKYKDLSWQFLKWMNEGPEFRMQAFQTHVFGFVASVKNYDLPKFFPQQMKTAFQESISGSNQTIMPVAKGMNEVFNIFRDNHDALTLGKMTAAEYTTKVDQELRDAMQKAYAN